MSTSDSSESRKKTRKLELGEEHPHNSAGEVTVWAEDGVGEWVLDGDQLVFKIRIRVDARTGK